MSVKSIFKKIIVPSLAFVFVLQSCMDVINVDLPEGKTLLVVDAWINNMDEPQVIKLSYSIPYFDNSVPPAVSGAIVTVTDNNNSVFVFEEDGNSGEYFWEDSLGGVFGNLGDSYELTVITSEGAYRSSAVMNRTPTVDSFAYEEYEAPFGGDLLEEGWEAEFYARDFLGAGDTYWIKAFRNDQYLNKPLELNFAYDAGFTSGSEIDGIVLIGPLRTAINRIPDSGDDAVDTSEYPPYVSGDKIRVEIHSMTNSAFEFLNEARNQMTLGDNTIFASPLINVPTNIEKVSGEITVVGCFNVAAVEFLEEIVP